MISMKKEKAIAACFTEFVTVCQIRGLKYTYAIRRNKIWLNSRFGLTNGKRSAIISQN